jgi:hypothetical protein
MANKYIIFIDYLHKADLHVSLNRIHHIVDRFGVSPTDAELNQNSWKNSQSRITNNFAYIFPLEESSYSHNPIALELSKRLGNIPPNQIKIIIAGHGSPIDKNNIYPTADANEGALRSVDEMSSDINWIFKSCKNKVFVQSGPTITLDICYSARTEDYTGDHSITESSYYYFWKSQDMKKSEKKETSLAAKFSQKISQNGLLNFRLTGRMTPVKSTKLNGRSKLVSIQESGANLLSLKLEKIKTEKLNYFLSKNVTLDEQIERNNDLSNIYINTTDEYVNYIDYPSLCSVTKINYENFVNKIEEAAQKDKQAIVLGKDLRSIIEYAVASKLSDMLSTCQSEMSLVTGQKTIWTAKNGVLSASYKVGKDI